MNLELKLWRLRVTIELVPRLHLVRCARGRFVLERRLLRNLEAKLQS